MWPVIDFFLAIPVDIPSHATFTACSDIRLPIHHDYGKAAPLLLYSIKHLTPLSSAFTEHLAARKNTRLFSAEYPETITYLEEDNELGYYENSISGKEEAMFNNGAITLMYHSLHNSREEYEALDAVDRPYSLSTTCFRQHLEHLVTNNIPVLDARDVAHNPAKALAQKHAVLLTFDDGHRSVHTHALPILHEYGLNAFVFLTTDKIAVDPQFLDWNDVNALVRADCVMGGHGTSHQFLDEMNAQQVHNELRSSRKIIEEHTGVPTLTMSLPGGRYNRSVLSECHKIGYQVIFTSEARSPILSLTPIRVGRFAIRHEIPLAEFTRMVSGNPLYALKKRSVQLAKKGLQKLIGNDRYYRIYRKLAERG